ncbi:MAG: hypothetical protein IVW57_07265 [Ktedonobacterales bacterium]|nr:hypothetical protein [Ktedonobacterales bacterium]
MSHLESAAKWGALVGAGTYLTVGILLALLGNLLFGPTAAGLTSNPNKLALGCLGIFALLFAFSTAGFFAGRETRRPSAGTLAGMGAFIVYALLSAIYLPGGEGAPAATSGGFLAQAIAALIVLGIAALMGWLGGRPGAQRGQKRLAPLAAPAVEAQERR